MLGIEGDFWVFAYGSLMWDPRFPVVDSRPARLNGYHRALCVLSIQNRGTPERPGLVVGLKRGGSCVGRALFVEHTHTRETLNYLTQRELTNHVYAPRLISVRLENNTKVEALAFVARPDNPQYAGHLDTEAQARYVLQGHGPYGSSLDYLRNVCRHLDEFGITDGPLHATLAFAEGGCSHQRA